MVAPAPATRFSVCRSRIRKKNGPEDRVDPRDRENQTAPILRRWSRCETGDNPVLQAGTVGGCGPHKGFGTSGEIKESVWSSLKL